MKICQKLKDLDRTAIQSFLDSFDTVLCDCDGVLWLSNQAVPGSPETIKLFRDLGKKVIFVTNNSNRTRNNYAIKFRELGYENVTTADIIHTGFLTSAYIHSLGFSQKVYVLGEEGLDSELMELGIPFVNQSVDNLPEDWNQAKIIETLDNLDPDVNCVMVGFDPKMSYVKMLKASNYIHRNPDCLFVVTDLDNTFPVGEGLLLPGTGPLVQSLKAITGKEPYVCGKPNPFVFETIQRLYPEVKPERTLMIGDRGNSDILLGTRCNLTTLMVGTGCHKWSDIENWQRTNQDGLIANFFLDSLGELVAMSKPE